MGISVPAISQSQQLLLGREEKKNKVYLFTDKGIWGRIFFKFWILQGLNPTEKTLQIKGKGRGELADFAECSEGWEGPIVPLGAKGRSSHVYESCDKGKSSFRSRIQHLTTIFCFDLLSCTCHCSKPVRIICIWRGLQQLEGGGKSSSAMWAWPLHNEQATNCWETPSGNSEIFSEKLPC